MVLQGRRVRPSTFAGSPLPSDEDGVVAPGVAVGQAAQTRRRTPASSAVAQPSHELRGPPRELTRFPLVRDLFSQVNFNERLIRNIFLSGQDLELIEHLARQSKRNR